jgi:hypothetical protein
MLSNSVGAIVERTYSDEVMTVKIGVEGLRKPNYGRLLNAALFIDRNDSEAASSMES